MAFAYGCDRILLSRRRWKILLILVSTIIFVIWQVNRSSTTTENSDQRFNYGIAHFNNKTGTGNRHFPLRVVHLDLKGAPPKMNYLKEILPIIAASGGNALLIEYEDMFPYDGLLKNISSGKAYAKEQIIEFLSLCEYYGIEVIPLVQTFGHLEFVLKLEEFRRLREVDTSPSEICPSNSDSLRVIREMLSQVLILHKNVKRIHIGCDEVFHLNICPRCLKRNTKSRDIFLHHIKTIWGSVSSQFPNVTLLMWDDMLRSWPANFIGTSNLNKYIQPVVWIYGRDIVRLIPHRYWYWYFKHFANIWIAGAFKGATDEMALIPNTRSHFENQDSWLKFISTHVRPSNDIVGYVLTGWSRYDHFASLCELLPVATPSLILNLLTVSSSTFKQRTNIVSSYNEILKCRVKNSFEDIVTLKNTESCLFPGQELIPAVQKLTRYRNKIKSLYERLHETNSWMTPFHLKYNYTNPWKVKMAFEEYKFYTFRRDFYDFCYETRSKLNKYYDEETIEEWFQEHVEFYLNKLRFLQESFKKSFPQSVWRRRTK